MEATVSKLFSLDYRWIIKSGTEISPVLAPAKEHQPKGKGRNRCFAEDVTTRGQWRPVMIYRCLA